jgi:hypothetical protein
MADQAAEDRRALSCMKHHQKHLITAGFCLLLLPACQQFSDRAFIEARLWSLQSGYGVGDFIDFDDSNYYTLRGDTLYRMNEALAVIKSLDRRERRLYLRFLQCDSIGVYYYHDFFEE